MAALGNFKLYPRKGITHELFATESMAMVHTTHSLPLCQPPSDCLFVQVINTYFEHLCRALRHDGSNSNLTHAAAVALGEHVMDPLEEARAMRDVWSPSSFLSHHRPLKFSHVLCVCQGGQGATACYRADFADLCSGKGKAYLEVAWALCVPSLSKLAVFHKCHNKVKEYPTEEVTQARKFFESPRNRMYLHASDADMLL